MSEEIGSTIRAERERRGWSQEFLAAKVGATQSTIDRIESGLTLRSRVLPEIISILDIKYEGFNKRQTYTSPVGRFARVTYVLPRDLIERIENYKEAIGVSSDDEVVRRIIDDFLKKRDDVVVVVNRIIDGYKILKSIREASSAILVNHPLVSTIAFDDDCVNFTFEDPLYKKLAVKITFWGYVIIEKEGGSPFMFHRNDAPKWARKDNITDEHRLADYLSF